MADRSLRIKLLADTSSYRSEMERASRLGNDYYKSAQSSSQRLTAYLNQNTDAFAGLNKNIQTATNTLKGFVGVFAGGFAITGIADIADNYGQMAQRIKNTLQSVDGDMSRYEMVQNRLVETSIRNAKDLADSQELYIRSAESMKTLGYNTNETLDFVESLSSAFTSNATSSDKVKSSIDSLNKAFVTGKVSSDQWQTLSASMPNLAGQIAKALGKERDEIAKLGNAGKLSMSELVNGAILSKDAFNDLADSMDNTRKDGVGQLSTAFQHYIGEANQTYKVTATVTSGMTYLAKNFDLVVDAGMALTAIALSRYFGNLTTSISTSTIASAKKAIELRNTALAQKEAAASTLVNIQAEKQFLITNQSSLASQLKLAQTEQSRIAIRNQMKANAAQIIALDKAETGSKLALAAATKQASIASSALNKAQGLLKGGMGLLGGPAGVAMLATMAMFSWINSNKEAEERALNLKSKIDDLRGSFESLSAAQLAAKSVEIKEDLLDVSKQVSSTEKDIERLKSALDSGAYKNANGLSSFSDDQLQDTLTKSIAKLETLKETSSGLSSLKTDIENYMSGAAGSAEKLAGKITNLDKALSLPNIDSQFNNLSQQLEISKIKSEEGAEAAYILAGLQRAAGDEALDHSAALYALAKGQEISGEMTDKLKKKLGSYIAVLKSAYADSLNGSSTKSSSVSKFKSLTDETKKLSESLSALQGSYGKSSAEQKILSLEQETGTKIIGTQREELIKLYNLMDGYNSLSSLSNPLTVEQSSYDNARKALDDWLSQNTSKQQEYYSKLEQLETEHQIKIAQIKSNQAVSDINNAVALVDPVQALANEQAKKLALIQEFENQRFLTEQQSLALREELNYKYEQNRVAAQWEIWKNQSEANEFLAASLEGLASSATSTISGLMSGTMSATEAMQNFANVILNQAIGSLVQMGLQQVQNAITSQTMAATTTAAQIAEATALAAAYTPAAMQASIATMGAAATTGAASYTAAMGTMKAASLVGMAHDGIDNIPQEGTWLLQKGERVLSPSQNKDFSSMLSNKSNSPQIIINNNAGAEVTASYDDREEIIKIAVNKATAEVASSVREKRGNIWNAFSSTTNVTSKL